MHFCRKSPLIDLMHADINITQIALIVIATLGLGLVFERLKQPAVLGYIIAGVILSAFNLIADRAMVGALAELGVIMLLYLVGQELNVQSFKKVWFISLCVTLGQLLISFLVIFGLGYVFDMSFGLSFVLASGIALSSTAVAIKMLETIGELRTDTGRLAIGILIAQDLCVVPLILIMKGYGKGEMTGHLLFQVTLSLVILIAVVWFLSRKQKLSLPFAHIYEGHEDLQPLAGMIFCFGCAAISGVLDLSVPYGAFLGGLIVGNSSQRQSMLATTRPIQSVLMMVFFLSVGLLLDFKFLLEHITKVIALLTFITVGKTVVNISLLHWLKQPWERAFLGGLILSQMGEFAFVMVGIGLDSTLVDRQGGQLILSLAALSLTLSPLWLMAARQLHDYAPKRVRSLHQLIETVYGPMLRKARLMKPKPENQEHQDHA